MIDDVVERSDIRESTGHFIEAMMLLDHSTSGESAFDKVWEEMPFCIRRDIFNLAFDKYRGMSTSGGTT